MPPTGLPRLNEIGVDGTVVLFTLAVSLVASLLFGSIPILKYASARLGTGLREGGRSMTESRERHRARSTLVVVQVALALVLLVSSGLMIRTFRALTRVDPGFIAPSEVQTLRVDIPDTDVKDPERVVRIQEEIWALPLPLPMFAYLVRPDGDGPFPLVIMNHGVSLNPTQRSFFPLVEFRDAAKWFAQRAISWSPPSARESHRW